MAPEERKLTRARSLILDLNQNSPREISKFRNALLTWYDENRRDLPWRRTRDVYAIWLSEIMLQQTRVAAVLQHYRIFLDRFPDIAVLAAEPEESVLAAWSGLGYYRRARMLHQCAREVMVRHGGRFPESAAALRELPGIGRYTAAAIASIAFAEPVAVVDGNVERVLERILGRSLSAKDAWAQAESFLARSRAGDFNQGMMELGATVCLPRRPRCETCPVRRWCATRDEAARVKGTPRKRKQEIWCVLDRRPGKVRLIQRPKRASLMAGMWELPQSREVPASARKARWRTFRHSITVTNYTVHVLRDWKAPPNGSIARAKWIAIDQIPGLPITGLTRKVLKAGGII